MHLLEIFLGLWFSTMPSPLSYPNISIHPVSQERRRWINIRWKLLNRCPLFFNHVVLKSVWVSHQKRKLLSCGGSLILRTQCISSFWVNELNRTWYWRHLHLRLFHGKSDKSKVFIFKKGILLYLIQFLFLSFHFAPIQWKENIFFLNILYHQLSSVLNFYNPRRTSLIYVGIRWQIC